MPDIIYSFKRYEKKYLLSDEQYEFIKNGMKNYIIADEHPRYSLCNIYYDTDDWRLIRKSIEKPVFKEKLRIRSYGVPKNGDKVFVELKKKFSGVVYKRRIALPAEDGFPLNIKDEKLADVKSIQTKNEIEWFLRLYNAYPRIFIGYDREAYSGINNSGLRITFDTNMRFRTDRLDLRCGDNTSPILKNDDILCEIKIPGACPIWLSRLLSESRAFPISFSKYGTCYRDHILTPSLKNKTASEKNKEVLEST